MSESNVKKSRKCGKFNAIVLSKKKLIAVILSLAIIAFAVCGGLGLAYATTSSPADVKVIVIDAGHGGIDNGVVGAAGTKESDFNLTFSKELAQYFTEAGFKVVMTRSDENGLYGDATKDFKRADMAERKRIIQEANPDFVISVHANKFPGDSRRGAQVFFDEFSAGGKALAEYIQTGLNYLNNDYTGRSYAALKGDYFMLKCTTNPSVIVECGFLSNAEDEQLLLSEAYRAKLAFAVYSGVVAYLAETEPTFIIG